MIETKFKNSEVGLIPEDWEVKQLHQILSLFGRIGFRGYNVTDLVQEGKGAITLSPSNIENGIVTFKKCTYLSWDKYEESPEIIVEKGDILLVKTGSTYGKIGYVDNLPWPSTINPQYVVLKKFKCNPRILAYLLEQKSFQDQIEAITSGGAIPTMSQAKILTCTVTLPTADEQSRIATALSDMDDLISTTKKLIEKKRNIKQGAMQELLSGKRRLPGFTEKWEEKKLDELLSYEQPLKYLVSSTEYTEAGIPVLTAGKTFILGYTFEDYGIFNNLPVIIFDDFVTESKYVDFPFKAKSSAMKMLSLRDKRNILKVIFELMQRIKFPMTEHKRYWISDYSKIKILLPHPEEQKAILQVINSFDEEINILENKLAKYHDLKQGMMQQLLTGKIRLI